MDRYIALLRGINISGKNKIAMSELKARFIEIGCEDVITYLNSGNVVFSIEEGNEIALAVKINQMIRERFSFDIPVLIVRQQTLNGLGHEYWT